MLVLVKCPKCGEYFEDTEEVFKVENKGEDSQVVVCDCGTAYNVTLKAVLCEAEEESEWEKNGFASAQDYWAWKTK